jgi:gamma-glutamylputrescine oxidase
VQGQTWYAASVTTPLKIGAISGTKRCDVCVIGGGYTGLSAALHLASTGTHVILLEADGIGAAASGRNGGQIHSGFRKTQAELEHWLGNEHARDLWSIAEAAKALLEDLIRKHSILCELKSGLVIAAHDEAAMAELEADAEHLAAHYRFPLDVLAADAIRGMLGTDVYRGGTFDRSGGHLHPLKLAYGLATAARGAGATIFEGSRVLQVEQERDGVRVRTRGGIVEAGSAILACDAFSADIEPSLGPYIGHVESFIAATEPLGDAAASILPTDVAVADTRHVLDYYRKSSEGRLLFAGRESYFRPPKDIARLVRPRMLKVFPALTGVRIDFAWSGVVGITFTRMPHFGRIGRLLFGHGYSGHGVALSLIGGKALAEASLGRSELFETLSRVPARAFPGGAWLRRPLITAALAWYKVVDAL